MLMKTFFVYIMTGRTHALYVGVTSDLRRRVGEHKTRQVSGFTAHYYLDRLVYVEEAGDARSAIEREKQIKRWRREKKMALVESINPHWRDLSLDW